MMNDTDDRAYYRRRADQERRMASSCEDIAVASIHQFLADAYEHRARQEIPAPRSGGISRSRW